MLTYAFSFTEKQQDVFEASLCSLVADAAGAPKELVDIERITRIGNSSSMHGTLTYADVC